MEKILKKLGYKDDENIAVINAPKELDLEIEKCLKFPSDKKLGDKKYSFIMFFSENRSDLVNKSDLIKALDKDGRVWIVYPKKSSKKYKSDLSRDNLWNLFEEEGFEPVSNFAVDDDWSSLRFKHASEINSVKRDAKREALKKEKVEKE